MPKEQVPVQHIRQFLPESSVDDVLFYLNHYRVHLTVTRQRQSILGDYRHAFQGKPHRISVNGNLNPYSFLVTLLHELAHLFTYERFGHRVQAHGTEWKKSFADLLSRFIEKKIFPADIEQALHRSLRNAAASSCGDEQLLRVLRGYDKPKENHYLLEQLEEGALFRIPGGRVFKKEARMRKRFRCLELSTGKWYLFSPVYEVIKVNGEA